jgi:hypothetical protein
VLGVHDPRRFTSPRAKPAAVPLQIPPGPRAILNGLARGNAGIEPNHLLA